MLEYDDYLFLQNLIGFELCFLEHYPDYQFSSSILNLDRLRNINLKILKILLEVEK